MAVIRGCLLAVVLLAGTAEAAVCPLVWSECLPAAECLTDEDAFAELGAPNWAWPAAQVIRSGALGKGPLDVIRWRSGHVDVGMWHYNVRPGQPYPGTGRPLRATEDLPLALLYWDAAHGYPLTWDAWYARIGPSVHRAPCDGCEVAVAAMANSSPSLVRRLGRAHGWDVRRMVEGYGKSGRPGSLHRPRRAARLLRGL